MCGIGAGDCWWVVHAIDTVRDAIIRVNTACMLPSLMDSFAGRQVAGQVRNLDERFRKRVLKLLLDFKPRAAAHDNEGPDESYQQSCALRIACGSFS